MAQNHAMPLRRIEEMTNMKSMGSALAKNELARGYLRNAAFGGR